MGKIGGTMGSARAALRGAVLLFGWLVAAAASAEPIVPTIAASPAVDQVAFAPDGRGLLTVSGDAVRHWAFGAPTPVVTRAGLAAGERGRAFFVPNGVVIDGPEPRAMTYDGVEIWRAADPAARWGKHVTPPGSDATGERLVFWYFAELRVWDARAGSWIVRESPAPGRGFHDADLDATGSAVLVHEGCGVSLRPVVGGGRARRWERRGCAASVAVKSGEGALSADGQAAASFEDGTLVWFARPGLEDPRPVEAPGRAWPLAFAGTGALVAGFPDRPELRVWAAPGEPPRTVTLAAPAGALAISPDGARAAAALTDGTVALVDLASGEILASFGHAGESGWMVWAPDGPYWASARAGDAFTDGNGAPVDPADPARQRPHEVLAALGYTSRADLDALETAWKTRFEGQGSPPGGGPGPAASRTQPAAAEARGADRELWLVSVGVADYAGVGHDLRWSDDDARAVAEAFAHRSAGFSKVHARVLVDGDATAAAIRASRDLLAAAGPEDVVALFVAGHGVIDAEGSWWFAPSDFDFDAPSRAGVSFEDLQDLLASSAARDRLLLVDACHAGEPFGPGAETLDGPAGPVVVRGGRSVAHLRRESASLPVESLFPISDDAGVTALAASSAAQFSIERDDVGHGVFTWALLRGLLSEASDADRDGTLLASELLDFARVQVRDATGGVQEPVLRRAASHDLVLHDGQLPSATWTAPEEGSPLLWGWDPERERFLLFEWSRGSFVWQGDPPERGLDLSRTAGRLQGTERLDWTLTPAGRYAVGASLGTPGIVVVPMTGGSPRAYETGPFTTWDVVAGDTLLVATWRETTAAWSLADGGAIFLRETATAAVRDLRHVEAFGAIDGRLIVAGGRVDGERVLLRIGADGSLESSTTLAESRHPAGVDAVFSARICGSAVVTWNEGLWTAHSADGTLLHATDGGGPTLAGFQCSPDGALVATWYEDASWVTVWEVATGIERARLLVPGARPSVGLAAASYAGLRFADDGGTVYLFAGAKGFAWRL